MSESPMRVAAMVNLGSALSRLGQIDTALAWHRKAASLDPDNAAAQIALAQTARARHDLDGSIAACEHVLRLVPDPRSVGRWRNYREHLGPLLEGLTGLVPEDD